MTIAIAIRTSSAVIFAADSKLTTQGVVGLEEDGSPRWVEQTYDNATKVVHDRSRTLMAMVAGPSNIGQEAATEFVSTHLFPKVRGPCPDPRAAQDQHVRDLITSMDARKRSFWEAAQVPSEQWPGPTVVLAAPSPDGRAPRVWRADLAGPAFVFEEILSEPGIRLEGAYGEVFTLLYAFNPDMLEAVRGHLGIEEARFAEAMRSRRVLAPIDKMNLWTMPVQDAIDLAVFLANVQVEMDRFLPGTPACGGPIDVMVLQMAPEPGILAYPGKALHHPRDQR